MARAPDFPDDGSRVELYELSESTAERENRAEHFPEVAQRLKEHAVSVRRSMPVF